MKTFLSLVLFIISSSVALADYYNQLVTIDGIEYDVIYPTLDARILSVDEHYLTDNSGNLNIPSSVTHNGKTFSVTSIEGKALYERTSLTSVVIPSSMTTILSQAFSGCTNLASVVIPNSVTHIAPRAFEGCTSLTSVEISSSMTGISEYTFSGCTSLASVKIPGSVTSIGRYAFEGCTSLASIVIPSSVTSIDYRAFSDCSGLTSVEIPSIGNMEYAFSGCDNVETLIYAEGSTTATRAYLTSIQTVVIPSSVTSISPSAFDGCSNLTSVEIPSSVTSIGGSAFRNCSNLASIEIPSSVTSIGNYTFWGCSSLASVVIPSSVTRIDFRAFENCTSLTSVVIPSMVTSIESNVFSGCTSLTSVVIPSSVTSISNYAFSGCTSLTSVVIPSSVTSISNYAFSGCTSLTSVVIPSSVTRIGESVFKGCTSLTSVEIPSSVTSISEYSFQGCTSLTSVVIPNSVTSISYDAFQGCSSLSSIEIPSSVTSIHPTNFHGCPSLTSISVAPGNPNYSSLDGVLYNHDQTTLIRCPEGKQGAFTIPNSLTSIKESAFSHCSITSIVIPSSVKNIGNEAFSGCKLREIETLATTPAAIGSKTFSGQSFYHTTLLVPVGCWDAYAYDDTYWYQFINIKETAAASHDLSTTQAYTLKNAADRSYLVYDEVNDDVMNVTLDANINDENPNHCWQVVRNGGEAYLYSIGGRKYLSATPGRKWILNDTPTPLSLTDGQKGVNIGDVGDWLFVLNDRISVNHNVAGLETITPDDDAAPHVLYDLQGRPVQHPRPGQLYVSGKQPRSN